MSRSYKKTPISKMAPVHGRIGKKFANRRVRRYDEELSNGGSYKRLYCSYDIHDWISYYTINDAIEFEMNRSRSEHTIQWAINNWKKHYHRK